MEDSPIVLATEIAEWSDFFVAMAGAAAALAGLLFVALSINIKEIVAERSLPLRALQTVALLVAALLTSGAALMPGLSERTLGTVVFVVTGGIWVFIAVLQIRQPRHYLGRDGKEHGEAFVWRVVITQTATLPGVVGAVVLLGGSANGIYFLAAGILLSFAVAVINAWVLLVEILR